MPVAAVEKRGTTLYVSPEGRLDTVRTPMLEKELKPYLEGTQQVVMDFFGVEYISSSGLRLLMWLEQQMEDHDGEVQVLHANENVLKIFELAGFTSVVHVIRD